MLDAGAQVLVPCVLTKWFLAFEQLIVDLFGQVADLIKEKKSPLVVLDTSRPLTAFRLMTEHGVTGASVVDAHGVLVDDISMRDLRGSFVCC